MTLVWPWPILRPGFLNAEKVQSSKSIYMTNGPLVLVEGIGEEGGGGRGMGYAWFRKGHAEDSEKSIEGDGHYGLLSECTIIVKSCDQI